MSLLSDSKVDPSELLNESQDLRAAGQTVMFVTIDGKAHPALSLTKRRWLDIERCAIAKVVPQTSPDALARRLPLAAAELH